MFFSTFLLNYELKILTLDIIIIDEKLKHFPTSADHQVIKTSWLTLGFGISSVQAARFYPVPNRASSSAVRLLAFCTPQRKAESKRQPQTSSILPFLSQRSPQILTGPSRAKKFAAPVTFLLQLQVAATAGPGLLF